MESPRFPDDIAIGSTGGPMFNTAVVAIKSGGEQRNINWDVPLVPWDVGTGIRRKAQIYSLLEHFMVVRGKGHGFRFKDWNDYKSGAPTDTVTATDQLLGTGDGVKTQFQLIKTYSLGGLTMARKILKPVSGTTLIALDDVPQGSGWSVDTTTGLVTFTAAPGVGVTVKAGYEFDIPARFDTDRLEISPLALDAEEIPNIPVIELRNPT